MSPEQQAECNAHWDKVRLGIDIERLVLKQANPTKARISAMYILCRSVGSSPKNALHARFLLGKPLSKADMRRLQQDAFFGRRA